MNTFINFKNENSIEYIINDFRVSNSNFYKIICIGIFLSLFIFLSFFWMPMVYVAITLAMIALLLIKGLPKMYLLTFLLPFYYVLKVDPNSFVLSSILLLCAIILLGLRYIKDILKKEKKFNYPIIILFSVFIVYIWLPIGGYDNIQNILKLSCTMIMLLMIYLYKEELNFKELILSLFYGILLASVFSFCRYLSPRLEGFLPNFPTSIDGFVRYTCLSADPNYFSVEILLLLSGFALLYFKGEIRNTFYSTFIVLSFIGFLTFSKSFILIYFLICILIFITFLLKYKDNKNILFDNLKCFFMILLFVFIVCSPVLISIIQRFFSDDVFVEFDDYSNNFGLMCNSLLFITTSSILKFNLFNRDFWNKVTTGRSELWTTYLAEIFSSPLTALFGCGVSSNILLSSMHNFYIECLYYLGIFGTLYLIFMGLYLFFKNKNMKCKFENFIVLIPMLLFFFSLNSLISYRPYILFTIVSYSIFYDSDNKNKEFSYDKI